MGTFVQDLRLSLRMLGKSKVFTAVAVLSLALGIGANTALFSLVDEVMLKTLPVREPGSLVLFNWLSGSRAMSRRIDGVALTDPETGLRTCTSFSNLAYLRMKERKETLSEVFAFAPLFQLNVSEDGNAEIASGQLVSGNYYKGLGVSTILGRTIADADDQPGASPVAVITHRYWQRRFGMKPDVIGKAITVNNVPVTIVGITPRGFAGALQIGEQPDLSLPLSAEPLLLPEAGGLTQHWFWWLRIMGRLNPGFTPQQAAADLEQAFRQSAEEGWDQALARFPPSPQTSALAPRDIPMLRASSGSRGLNELRREYSVPLLILQVIVGLVLLIACTNVANLLLARVATREKEMAIRLALGASRLRLIRQLLTESVLLSGLAGVVGAVFAYWGKDLLLALRPWGGSQLTLNPSLDLRVLGFTTAISISTGVLFGLVPALRATRVDLAPTLKETAWSVTSSRSLFSKSLMVLQVAMSLVLLIGAALFVRTLRNLERVDVGFNRDNLLTFSVDPELNRYKEQEIATLYHRLTERIEAVPGVRSASVSLYALLSGSARISSISVQDVESPASGNDNAYVNVVGPDFFRTMEISLVSGRSFGERDDKVGPLVAVVNQVLARKYFGDESPIGKRFGFGGRENSRKIEIIGVASDAKYASIRSETPPTVYVPYQQQVPRGVTFVVRAVGEPAGLTASLREAVRQIDKNLPMFDVKTQDQQIAESLSQETLFATLSSFFGMLALLLACIGLYGIMSYGVACRTNEIGIRMALGATTRRVASMVMLDTLLVVVIGVVIGLGTALATTRLLNNMLFGLTPGDPLALSAAVILMLIVAGIAGYLPARRASRVDPMTALRYE